MNRIKGVGCRCRTAANAKRCGGTHTAGFYFLLAGFLLTASTPEAATGQIPTDTYRIQNCLSSVLGAERDVSPPLQAKARKLSFENAVSSVFETNIDHDEGDLDAYGYVVGTGVRFRSDPADPGLELGYEIARHRYSASDRWDRISHRAHAVVAADMGSRTAIQVTGEVSLKGSTDDRELANTYTLEPRLEFKLGRANRIRLTGGVRAKQYDDAPGSNAVQPSAELGFKRRFAGGASLELSTRFDVKHSVAERSRYERWTQEVQLEFPLGIRGNVALQLKHRTRRYPFRFVDVGNDAVLRRDRQWMPAVSFGHRLGGPVELLLDYRFEGRISNDPDKGYRAHSAGLTLRTRI